MRTKPDALVAVPLLCDVIGANAQYSKANAANEQIKPNN